MAYNPSKAQNSFSNLAGKVLRSRITSIPYPQLERNTNSGLEKEPALAQELNTPTSRCNRTPQSSGLGSAHSNSRQVLSQNIERGVRKNSAVALHTIQSEKQLRLLPKSVLGYDQKPTKPSVAKQKLRLCLVGGGSFMDTDIPYFGSNRHQRASQIEGSSNSASKFISNKVLLPSEMIRESYNRRSAEKLSCKEVHQKLNRTVAHVEETHPTPSLLTLEKQIRLLEADNANLRRMLSESVRDTRDRHSDVLVQITKEKTELELKLSYMHQEQQKLLKENKSLVEDKIAFQQRLNSDLQEQLSDSKKQLNVVEKYLSHWDKILSLALLKNQNFLDLSVSDTREFGGSKTPQEKTGITSPMNEREKRVRWTDQVDAKQHNVDPREVSNLDERLEGIEHKLKYFTDTKMISPPNVLN